MDLDITTADGKLHGILLLGGLPIVCTVGGRILRCTSYVRQSLTCQHLTGE